MGRNEERDLFDRTTRIDEYGNPIDSGRDNDPIDFSPNPDMNALEVHLRALEAKRQLNPEEFYQYLITKGWYKPEQLEWSKGGFVRVGDGQAGYLTRKLKGKRLQIKLDYPKIPTNMMVEFTKKYSVNHFIEKKVKLFSVPSEIQVEYKDLLDQAMKEDVVGKGKSYVANISNPVRSQEIYNQYLHWSASGGLVHCAQHSKSGALNRSENRASIEGGADEILV